VFVPAGPMASGLSNTDKSKVRERFAQGQVGRDELLKAESAAYHAPGTCTFYGTANSNQMLLEAMGLHVPGAAFVHPHAQLREALTREAVRALLAADIDDQRSTPLTLLRSAVRYPTEVLRAAGVPAVERDPIQARLLPDDLYDLSPARFADVDPALAEPGMVWGAAKAFAHRRRHTP